MRRLLLHLARALGVMFHLRDKELQLAASLDALDKLQRGVILLDASAHPTFCNKLATAWLDSKGPVCIATTGQLAVQTPYSESDQLFKHAVARALQPLTNDVDEHYTNAILLRSADGSAAYAVHVAPLSNRGELASGASVPRAVVIIADLRSASSLPASILNSQFDLTHAEARAALEVARGGSVEEMSQRLGVSANTLKSQLQAVYMKTGTHRQVDMLKLLAALSPQ